MEYDLYKTIYDVAGYKDYVYGSAEVVGLMCLAIFCEKDRKKYESLKAICTVAWCGFSKSKFS